MSGCAGDNGSGAAGRASGLSGVEAPLSPGCGAGGGVTGLGFDSRGALDWRPTSAGGRVDPRTISWRPNLSVSSGADGVSPGFSSGAAVSGETSGAGSDMSEAGPGCGARAGGGASDLGLLRSGSSRLASGRRPGLAGPGGDLSGGPAGASTSSTAAGRSGGSKLALASKGFGTTSAAGGIAPLTEAGASRSERGGPWLGATVSGLAPG